MDVFSLLRTMGALILLLGLMAGALWAVRRFNLRLPGAATHQSVRRLELVERLIIDQRRSAVLIRRDDREHLLIVSPEGQVVVETYLRPEGCDAIEPQPVEEKSSKPSLPRSFSAILEKTLSRRGSAALQGQANGSGPKALT